MSPAKRLSRQRFRALCERYAKWIRLDTRDCDRDVVWHATKHIAHLTRAGRRSCARDPFSDVMRHVAALARLAR